MPRIAASHLDRCTHPASRRCSSANAKRCHSATALDGMPTPLCAMPAARIFRLASLTIRRYVRPAGDIAAVLCYDLHRELGALGAPLGTRRAGTWTALILGSPFIYSRAFDVTAI